MARALPWHGRGQGFKSLMVHNSEKINPELLGVYFFNLMFYVEHKLKNVLRKTTTEKNYYGG